MTPPPNWVLALIYWLHLLATVAWAGSLAAIALLVLPAMQQANTKVPERPSRQVAEGQSVPGAGRREQRPRAQEPNVPFGGTNPGGYLRVD